MKRKEDQNELYRRFSRLGFDDFRKMAEDDALSRYEKIGFPDDYRRGQEQGILNDIKNKVPALAQQGKTILDIGSGCSDLAHYLIELSEHNGHQLIMIDSKEMLALLPDSPSLRKEPHYFPDCPPLLEALDGKVDAIICYSVFHYIFQESNVWAFIDKAMALLAPSGRLLIGDVPNISKRKRFFASDHGMRYHKAFMNTDEPPTVAFNQIEPDAIDDAVVTAMLMRARLAGFDAYVMPQADHLPMANRREDILIVRP